MKKIKVLMLGWEYPPYVTGGLGTHTYHLMHALAKEGVQVYFITPHPIHQNQENLQIIGLDISQKFKENGKIVNYGSSLKQKIRAYTRKIPEVLKKYDFDLIHCQDVHPMEAAISVKAFFNKPLVCTVHSTIYDQKEKPNPKNIEIERKGMESADRIIAVSNYTKNIIVKKYNISPRKISIITNAVKQKKIPPAKKIGKTKYVLYLGRLAYQKGIPFLIRAAKKVLLSEKNVKFIIIGRGEKSYEEKLKKEVKKLGLENDIIFLGYVNNKNYHFRKAHILVMPSVSEPFGIVPLEALIEGTPAIVSRQSGVSEVLKSCIKFDYWEVNDLADKILFLLRNKKAYNRLRNDGLKEIKKFTWDGIAEETIELYRKILNMQ